MALVMMKAGEVGEATRKKIHRGRVVDDSRHGRLSVVEIEPRGRLRKRRVGVLDRLSDY
jgi:hypothetical protein